MAGGFPPVLHGTRLEPCPGAGLRRHPRTGKRTVTQALRVMGLAGQPGFGRYHEVLNRARWDARDLARRLLLHLLAVLSPSGEVVVGIDDTIERRWGGKIKARGIYRDAVRSSEGQFVKACPCEGGDQRFALAVAGGDAACPVREPPLGEAGQGSAGVSRWKARRGAAVPDRAGAVGTLERGARPAA